MGADLKPAPTLYEHIERRRRELGLRPEAIVHPNTRRKIRRGEAIRPDVYDTIDRRLQWQTGSAQRVARGEGEPVELDNSPAAAERRLQVVGKVTAVMTTGDLDEEALREIEVLADAIWRIIDRRNRK